MTTTTLTITIPFSGETIREVDEYFVELMGVAPLGIAFNKYGRRKNIGQYVPDGGGRLTRFDVTIIDDDVLPVAEWFNRTAAQLEIDFIGHWMQVS